MAFPDDELDILVEAFLGADPTADPGTWPSATDLSARLLDEPITITRGRASGQFTLSSGSCTFVLNNDEIGDGTGANAAGVLTPLLATSPYYGTWDLGVPVRISVTGVGSSPPYRRFSGFVASIEATVIPIVGGGTHSAVRVTLGGKVRQMSQGSVPEDALHRFIRLRSPRAYWPLTAGESSTEGLAWTSGTDPMGLPLLSNVDTQAAWSGAQLAPHLSPVLHLQGVLSVLAGPVPGAAPSTAIAFDWVVRSRGNTGGQVQLVARYATTDGTDLFSYAINGNYNSGTPNVALNRLTNDAFAASLDTGDAATAEALWDDGLHHWRVLVEDNGADVDITVYLDGVEVMAGSHTTSQLRADSEHRHELANVDLATGYAAVWTDADIPDVTDTWSAVRGWAGEQAHDRIERVCTEEGIPYSSSATFGQACGPQPIADALSVLRDAEAVDHGMLTELRDTWGFGYVSGDERYNQAAALTIDLSTYRVTQGDSAIVLVPSRNDRRTRNEWTVSRVAGSEATVVDTDHQAKHGRYNDAVTVNLYLDDQAMHDAGWRVREGTVEGLRYGTIPLDIGANASALLQDWLDLDLGARVDRTNHPTPPHPHDDIAVTLEGYTEAIRRKAWKANLVTEPYEPYNVRELNEDTDPDSNVFAGRWAEEDGTALDEAIDSTAPSFDVDPNGGTWTTDDDEFDTDLGVGLFIEFGGEVMQVTDIADAGGGIYTFTVVRSVNAVVKSHSSGAPLKVVDAQIWAL